MLFQSKNFLGRYLEGEIFPDKRARLLEFKTESLQCTRCPLRSGCTQVVFGEGNPEARLMFIGEGPGEDEDQQGRPFVGKAGQLLDRILEAARLPRHDVYISNVVKCRPPANRKPEPGEMKGCLRILAGELLIIRPRLIVLLGSTALQGVIDPDGSITRLRGKWMQQAGIQIMPTYHPGALLRDESKKRDVWEDFKQVQEQYQRISIDR